MVAVFLMPSTLSTPSHFSAVKPRLIGREGHSHFRRAQSLYEHCPTRKNYGLYGATVLVYRAMVE